MSGQGSGFFRQISVLSLVLLLVVFSFGCGSGTTVTNTPAPGGTGGPSPTPPPPPPPPPPPTTSPEALYALTTAIQGPNSALSTFTIGSTGALTSSGSPVVFLSPNNASSPQAATHPSGRFIFETTGGLIMTFQVGVNGVLTQSSSVAAPSLGFQILVEPSGHFLYANQSAGTNGAIATYSIDQNAGVLTPVGQPQPQPLGFLVMDPKGRFLYVINIGQIQAFTINTTSGALTPGALTTGLTTDITAASPDGKFLYTGASHPRDNGFEWTGFLIDPATGALTSNNSLTAFNNGGTAFDPAGHFLFANDNAGIRVLAIDPTTGMLTDVPGSPFSRGTVASSSTNGEDALAVNRTSQFLFITDGQKVGSFSIASTGALTEVTGSPVPLTGVPTTAISAFTVQPPQQ